MKTVRISLEDGRAGGKIDTAKVDATTDIDIARHRREDRLTALKESADFARGVRQRLGLSQLEFSQRINVPLDTIRNWEQGKRTPTGPAKTLLRVLDKAPEAALAALA